MALAMDEYEALRSDPRHFALLPEHFNPGIERVMERNEQYWVVEEFGIAGDLAAKVDPRKVGLRGQSDPATAS